MQSAPYRSRKGRWNHPLATISTDMFTAYVTCRDLQWHLCDCRLLWGADYTANRVLIRWISVAHQSSDADSLMAVHAVWTVITHVLQWYNSRELKFLVTGDGRLSSCNSKQLVAQCHYVVVTWSQELLVLRWVSDYLKIAPLEVSRRGLRWWVSVTWVA